MTEPRPSRESTNEAKTWNAAERSYHCSLRTASWCLHHMHPSIVIEEDDQNITVLDAEYVDSGNCVRCGFIGVNDNLVQDCNCPNDVRELITFVAMQILQTPRHRPLTGTMTLTLGQN